jgi:ADP-dependent NAD(P)H-hydrate dehydratase
MSHQLINQLPTLPIRPSDAHKGTFGRVLIMAGSRGMSGAAALSGLGALRGGAGLVYLAVPREIQGIVGGIEPSYLTIGCPASIDGQFTEDALLRLEDDIAGCNAMACGPGLGQSEELQHIVGWLLVNVAKPMVVDADALNLLAEHLEWLDKSPAPRVLTPHPGEFARLLDTDTRTVQAHRVDLAVEFAARHKVILVLKGSGTVITDGKHVAINPTGNSGMATGGTGDVLTGLVTALLAQGLPPFEAARLGVYLHGLAGDLAAEELSQPGLIASDLPRYLGPAWRTLSAELAQPRSN